MKNYLLPTILNLACLVMLPSLAQASVVMTLDEHGGGAGTKVYLADSLAARTNQGGIFYWSSDPNVSPEADAFLPDPIAFITFCIELTQNISYGSTYTYDIIDMATAPQPGEYDNPMGGIAAGLIRELWYLYIDEATSTGVVDGYTASERQGAFQLAIWELVYDEGVVIDLTDGWLEAQDTDERALATQWLNSLSDPIVNTGMQASLAALSSPYRQDQLVEVEVSLDSQTVIPEPSTYIVFGGLILCFGLAGWWPRRRAAAAK